MMWRTREGERYFVQKKNNNTTVDDTNDECDGEEIDFKDLP
jgi:hypothetical protein